MGLLDDIPPETWTEAATVLNEAGVFGNEWRAFPTPSVLESNASDLDRLLRKHGYTGGNIGFAEVYPAREGVTLLVLDTNKIADLTTAEMRWYEDYRKRWRHRVTERVADWLQRLNGLKEDMRNWMPAGFSLKDRPPVPLHQELMRKFNVAQAMMPSFDIVQGSTSMMRVQPKALWTIGANGRVDLVRRQGTFILIDHSEPLSGKPEWEYYSPGNRRETTRLDKETFLTLLV